MGTVTVPRLEGAVPRAKAVAMVDFLRSEYPHVEAYPHGWGNDWGVTITDPAATDEELKETYHSLHQLGLLTPP